jgi:multisite-specific tRNA:(cytosine-C5)-methyltransferase
MARGAGARRGRQNRHKPNLPTKRRRQENAAASGDGGGDQRARQGFLEPKDRKSEALEEYYTAQAIVPAEELPQLFKSLAVPLPTSFRVTADSRFRDDICDKLENEFKELFDSIVVNHAANNGDGDIFTAPAPDSATGVAAPADAINNANDDVVADPTDSAAAAQHRLDLDESEPIVPPSRLPWYPGGLGWTVATPRFLVRRNNVLAPFHQFLVRNNTLGLINRQEAVSMVPPLLLDVQHGHSVLDLCAAPGSKSAQLLEALANSASAPKGLSAGGLVIANDADIKRCWMLAHQLKRFGAPNLMVTHHDAQNFPAVTPFDRVLCDVPCSGDGTLRKAPDMWRRWTPMLGNGIHRLQKNILCRGVQLLSAGGRIVYSTCSMNPVENEAIVADALRHFGPDVLELIDVTQELPQLKRRPGLVSWKVKDTAGIMETGAFASDSPRSPNPAPLKRMATAAETPAEAMIFYNKMDGEAVADAKGEVAADNVDIKGIPADGWFTKFSQVPERRQKRVVESLFPPSAEELASGHFPLERCMRLVPYDQDTGSFFVAVLVKKGKPPVVNAPVVNAVEPIAEEAKKEDPHTEVETNVISEVDEISTEGNDGVKHEQVGAAVEAQDTDEIMPQAETKDKTGGGKDRHGSRLITDDPLVGLEKVNEGVLEQLSDCFGLDLVSCRECFMTRGSEKDKFKRVLLVSPAVRAMLKLSMGSPEGVDGGAKGKLRVVNAGVRIFERTGRRDAMLPFRILSDGTEVLRRSMTKRIVQVEAEDLKKMLVHETIDISSFSGRESRVALTQMTSGSAVMVCGTGSAAECVLIWKGQYKVTKLMPSDEVSAMQTRHGVSAEVKIAKEGRACKDTATKARPEAGDAPAADAPAAAEATAAPADASGVRAPAAQ